MLFFVSHKHPKVPPPAARSIKHAVKPLRRGAGMPARVTRALAIFTELNMVRERDAVSQALTEEMC